MGPIQHEELRKARPFAKRVIKFFARFLKYTSSPRRIISPFFAGLYIAGLFFVPQYFLEWTAGTFALLLSYRAVKSALIALFNL